MNDVEQINKQTSNTRQNTVPEVTQGASQRSTPQTRPRGQYRRRSGAQPAQISADALSREPQQFEAPTPTPQPNVDEFVDTVMADTQTSQQRDDVFNELQTAYNDTTSTQDTYRNALDEQSQALAGQGFDSLSQELKNENLKLAKLQGRYRTRRQQIADAEGQSQVFQQAQDDALDRERAVEVGNQALLVQALQGNYDQARETALQVSNFASEDRKTRLNNLLNQYNALDGRVNQEQQVRLEGERQRAQNELRRIERMQGAVDRAIESGSATAEEMQRLTSPQVSDRDKQALAQQITSRAQAELRALEERQIDADIRQSEASIANSRASQALAERKFQFDKKQALQEANDEITKEDAETQKQTENALEIRRLVDQVANDPALDAATGFYGSRLPSLKTFTGATTDFDASYQQLKNQLTVGQLDKMSGVLSESDIRILESAATRLRTDMSGDEFRDELQTIRNTVNRTIENQGITDEQARFYSDLGDDDIGEIDSLLNDNL